jgi:Rrf2 family protein
MTRRQPTRVLSFRRDGVKDHQMRVSAKADYALRAVAEIAAGGPGPVKAERISQAQSVPLKFLENILVELKHADLVQAQRGAEGGYRLARPADTITLADVIRAIDGPLANIRGVRPEDLEYVGPATRLRDVWIAVRANLRLVLEAVTIADLAQGTLPAGVGELIWDLGAWQSH